MGVPIGESSGLRLNLGCGFDYRPGFVNIDLHPQHNPDLVCDVTWLRPMADGSCIEVVAQDVLEHLHRSRCLTALLEWNRVLALTGRLRLRVPSLKDLLVLLDAPDRQGVAQQKLLIQCVYGTQGYEGDFHHNAFTEVTLRADLEEAGFAVRSLSLFDEWLFTVEAEKVAERRPAPLLRTETDPAFLEGCYRELLGRSIDASGQAYYSGLLGQGIPREAILESLIASPEYQARHPSPPPMSDPASPS